MYGRLFILLFIFAALVFGRSVFATPTKDEIVEFEGVVYSSQPTLSNGCSGGLFTSALSEIAVDHKAGIKSVAPEVP